MVEFRLGKTGRRLLQDLLGGAQLIVLALQLLDPGLGGAIAARMLSGVALSLDAPFAKQEHPSFSAIEAEAALPLEQVGAVFFEQPDSGYAELGWLARYVLFFRHGSHTLSFRLVCLAD